MKLGSLLVLTLMVALLAHWLTGPTAYSATASPALLKAKQQAEANGYLFFTSHNDIVEMAKKEGKLRVLASQYGDTLKAIVNAFRKKYPFIDVKAEEVAGTETYQRMLAEMKTGLANWDVNYLGWDSYTQYLPYMKKVDILGMAEQGVLQIPPKMIDPVQRNIVALQSNAGVVIYNSELISSEKVPNTLEDFLKPEFKGRKFALDVRSPAIPALVPFWGLEKVLDIARKLVAQEPIWYRGSSRAVTMVSMGEVGPVYGINYATVKRNQEKDVRKVLQYKVVEPVPARLTEAQAILATAANPHAGLLWLELEASPEGQKIIDQVAIQASLLSPGSVHEQLTRGKKVSLVDWDHFQKTGDYEKKIVEALGFPRADRK
ncbi:MAG: ABC transporter substrate-binding protein [Deltaproteobacteria bacterium]|nr:ABC transporter substrate-binding protein [Deltaproteobacteria bacterium]